MSEPMRALVLLGGLMLVCARPLPGAEPALTHVHPAAVERGATTEVKLVGTFDPWPCHVWAANSGLVFTPGTEAGVVTVAVAAEVPAGPHLIRAFNADGASAPVALVVADTPQTLEAEPNDDFRSPQDVPSPTATVNGRHEKAGDVDCFGVTMTRGQVLVARVEAYVLAAGFDSMLRVVDEHGSTLAFNHDHVTMDPFLVFTAPRDGRYVVQAMGHAYPASTEIRFAGGPTCVYRLHLTTGPVVRNTWPLALTRGAPVEVALDGWNLALTQLPIDPAAPPANVPVILSDHPEVVECEDRPPLVIPSAISARLESPGSEDTHVFHATKDSVLELRVTGRQHGSAIDAWLKIRDADGKELATSDDDGGSLEPRLVWTAPADGQYTAVVGDVTHGGGPQYFYRLSIAPVAPAVVATFSAHTMKVEAGKSADVKAAITLLHGFKSRLTLAAVGLPAGVTADTVEVPEAGGEVTLTLSAEPGAAAASGPVRFVLRETDGGSEHPVIYSLATTSENNGVPQGYQHLLVNTTDQLWLTVVPAPAAPANPPAETPAGERSPQ